jgi:hypothetical protein
MEDESTVLEFAHIFLQKKNGKKKEEKTERKAPHPDGALENAARIKMFSSYFSCTLIEMLVL